MNVQKMAQISKFKIPFVLKLNFNWGLFDREISKFGYFKNLEKNQNKFGKKVV